MGLMTMAELTEPERRLIESVVSGEQLSFATAKEQVDAQSMTGWGDDRTIRCELIRQIMLDRFPLPDGARPDPKGIWLRGARLAGGLDLAGVESNLPLSLLDCHTGETVRLGGCHLQAVDLSGLVGKGIEAHEARFARRFVLRNARLSCRRHHGTVCLVGAQIGAVLDLSGSHLVNTHPDNAAVHAGGVRVGGGAFFNHGFRARGGGEFGSVRLSGAVIDGQLSFTGAALDNPKGPALVADYLQTSGSVMMNHEFLANGRRDTGTVRLVGARIGGRLMCEGGQARANEPGDLALNLSQAHVGGDLLLPPSFAVGPMELGGLTYNGMVRSATLAEWLDMLATRTPRYASQPYFQLASAHQAAGHERDVRRIHLARHRDLLRRGDLDLWARTWHRITGVTVGYGYRPATALLWLVATLLASVLLVTAVAAPAGLTVRSSTATAAACSPVEQIGLALNAAVPLIKPDGQQRCQLDSTTGRGQLVVAASWVLQILAWGFLTLFVAGFTGLVRKSP
jgi:hypothetical protein